MNARTVIVLAATLAVWVATLPAHASGLEYSAASPDAAQIDAFLTRKTSPLAGIGGALSSLARDYDVDPRLVIAIAGAETTFGQHQCTSNNAWNWFHHGSCVASSFSSYQEGVEHVTKYMRLSYLNRGYDSIELIRYKYCATGCDNWTPLVTMFYDAMPAGAQTGTPPSTPVPPSSQPPASSPSSPSPTQASQPSSGPPPTPNSDLIFGIPRYVVYLLAALAAAWALSSRKR